MAESTLTTRSAQAAPVAPGPVGPPRAVAGLSSSSTSVPTFLPHEESVMQNDPPMVTHPRPTQGSHDEGPNMDLGIPDPQLSTSCFSDPSARTSLPVADPPSTTHFWQSTPRVLKGNSIVINYPPNEGVDPQTHQDGPQHPRPPHNRSSHNSCNPEAVPSTPNKQRGPSTKALFFLPPYQRGSPGLGFVVAPTTPLSPFYA